MTAAEIPSETSIDVQHNQKMSQKNIWELQGPMLQRQRRRAQVISRSLKRDKVKRILDIGCAEGYTTSFISEVCDLVVGIELNIESLKVAKTKVKKGMFISASIEHLPFRANSFDTVCILEVLEHLPLEVQRKGLKEADRVLRDNRGLVISVPYKEQVVQTKCIHCNKPTPMYGHLHSLDVEKVSSLVPANFKLIEVYHLPNIQIASCSNLLKPIPLIIWLRINSLLGLVRKGYWIIVKYQKFEAGQTVQ
jgi:ubiquinone/menaquinone biosynthesis C-methylase UbiE